MSSPRSYYTTDGGNSITAANKRIERMFETWEAKQTKIDAAQRALESSKAAKRRAAKGMKK